VSARRDRWKRPSDVAVALCCLLAAQAFATPPTASARAADANASAAAATAASGPRSKIAPKVTNQAEFDKLDCATQLRVYRESQDCFAPYIQQPPYVAPPEAHQKCVELKEPSLQCGLPATP
jgi:hypothetical protein